MEKEDMKEEAEKKGRETKNQENIAEKKENFEK